MSALVPRDDFPALAELTYLNTASVGLVPAPVQEKAEEFDRDVAVRGTVALDEEAEIAVFEGTRASAARLIGAEPDEVAITASATLALGQIAWFLRPGRGDNVVSVDLEFPSSTYPWLRVAEDTGAEVRLVQRRAEPEGLSLEDVAALVDRRTKVVCVSHVQYATGHRLDPARLAALAHEHDAVLVLDASQSAGAVPIDVRADDVDFLVATSYKWLCSSFGAAICYVRSELVGDFRPPLVGWRSAEVPYALDAVNMNCRRRRASSSSRRAATARAWPSVRPSNTSSPSGSIGFSRMTSRSRRASVTGSRSSAPRSSHRAGRAADRNRDGAFPRPGRRGSQHA